MNTLKHLAIFIFLAAIIFFGAAVKSTNAAATFTVNSKGDSDDANLGDGVCRDSLGYCTLRAAIEEANKLAGDDTIIFSTTLTGQTIVLDSLLTDIDITSNITINGLGASNLAVSGNNAVRVFNITSGTVSISGLTIRDGKDNSAIGGGGIYSESSALTLTNMTVSSNTASFGGGVYVFRGSLTMTGSTVSNNNTTGSGGGVVLNNVPSASITNSNIAGNNAMDNTFSVVFGGGIYSLNSTLTLTGTSITSNHADNSMGLAYGGGMFVRDGGATIINCTVAGNTTKEHGGGVGFSGGTHRISGTTFSGNNTGNYGGGFMVESAATVSAANSTVSGNTANRGGGIYNRGILTLRNVTVAGNTGAVGGGGIFYDTGSTTLANTIVADNTAPTTPDIAGPITSLGNNLVRTRGSSSGYVASDLPDGTNPMLGALANNGGITQTRALSAGSPAINAGNNAQALDTDNATPLTSDQRGAGFARIVNTTVDIGAFEVQAAPTAAGVAVGGRVMTADGRGIRNARVTLTDSNGESQTVLTGKLGYYRFDDVRAGETYVIAVRAKRFTFGQPTRVQTIVEETFDINFVAAVGESKIN